MGLLILTPIIENFSLKNPKSKGALWATKQSSAKNSCNLAMTTDVFGAPFTISVVIPVNLVISYEMTISGSIME